MSRALLTLGYPPRAIVGKALQHYGVLIMKRTQARMVKNAISTMCLPIAAKRRKFIPSPPKGSQTLNGLMQQSSIA
jgi:hypothetical protein